MRALAVARFTLAEAVSRRLVLAGAVLSVVFIGLFALGSSLVVDRLAADTADANADLIGSAVLAVLGLYAVHMLSGLLALLLAVGAVSSDVDTGTLHAALVRPLARWEHLLGRWLALAGVAATYAVAMSGALLVTASLITGYAPAAVLPAIALLALEAILLVTLGLLGSTMLSTLANGVVVFSLFMLAWLGGIVEFVGDLVANDTMVNLGVGVSLLVPNDAIWRGRSFYLQPEAFVALMGGQGLPFAGTAPPTALTVAWAVGYVAVCLAAAFGVFARRDL